MSLIEKQLKTRITQDRKKLPPGPLFLSWPLCALFFLLAWFRLKLQTSDSGTAIRLVEISAIIKKEVNDGHTITLN
jgi:hypothetical protein